jgi:hypothetical protein
MKIRLFGALLCGAALMLATQTDLAQAEKTRRIGGPTGDSAGTGIPDVVGSLKTKGPKKQATTVKSSKSNTSDRMGGGGGGKGSAAKATTVKSSKSNTSD